MERMTLTLGHPTFRTWLRQRLCGHTRMVGHAEPHDFGEATRCENCGYTVWTDPPDLQDRVAEWIAAHSATAPTSGGEGVASESRSGTAIAGEAKGHPAKDSQVAADAPSPSGETLASKGQQHD